MTAVSLYGLVESTAQREPEAVALSGGGRSITYAELMAAMAGALSERSQSTVVGILMPPGIWTGVPKKRPPLARRAF
jgi:hypothetical protein